jgi:hypothetical protein
MPDLRILAPMFAHVDTRKPHEVEAQVRSIYQGLFPGGEVALVARAFAWADQCFAGGFADYQPIDASYHDFEHTLQGTLCLARLLHGRHAAGAKPGVTPPAFELALLAILFHDTGYLKKRGDTEGTGAKYTVTHVARGADFAREFLSARSFAAAAIESVRNMIRCTGVNADLKTIPFQNELERALGCALGTADLLGQMAAPDYVEKLPALHEEFAEAVRHDGPAAARLAVYRDAGELVRNTPSFWENYVLPKINDDFGKLHVFLNDPYPDGPNPYLQAVQRNLARIQETAKQQP